MQQKQQAFTPPELPVQARSAIESEAKRRGITYDELCLQLLLERAHSLKKKGRFGPVAQLFGFQRVH